MRPMSDWAAAAAVLRHELREQLRHPRTALLFVLAFCFFALAFAQGGDRVREQAKSQAEAQAENRRAWLEQGEQNPHAAAHFPVLITKPAAPLGALAEGAEAALGGHVFTDAHRVLPVVGSRAGDAPIAQAVGGLDAAFVVGVVLSLLAALFGADLVAGEKERGTLRLLFSNPLGRGRWLLAKGTAHTTAFLLAVGLSAPIAWFVTGGVPLGGGWGWRLLAFAFCSAVYLALWVWLGVVCSVLSSRLAPAVLGAIALWVVLVPVAPRTLSAIAELTSPPPLTAPARLEVRVAEVSLRQEQGKLVEAAAARGELASASAFVQTEGTPAIRDHIDAQAAQARSRAEAPLTAWREGQLARLGRLSVLTPTALYFELASAFAGTDWQRHAAFISQANTYRADFIRRLDAMEDQGIETFTDYASIGAFNFEELAPAALFGKEASRVALLLGFFAAALVFAAWRMRRYDLR
ncbi:ABC transporter permease subunit [bacterium]|nr:ABC transporter permease subunit [bacterium]